MDSPRAPNPDFERAVADAVLSMPAARHLGFQVGRLAPGEAELVAPYRAELTQHDGFVQGGVLGALADFAGGCAAGTLLPAGWANMTIDYTVKIVAPARGDRIVARGRVVRAGPTISVAAADVYSSASGGREVETLCATALVTLRNIRLPDPRRGAER
ncbi:PaaI family thioesterase [Parafrankia discariae]|uniref:PaaI family thioesterase n=1 Tax=Parafrankia discariae TaxID=365528 RepID=UPI000379969D|nr:PaaI family thioesterase [Parafrankia discariae]